jgi:hypothetical protein
VLQKHMHALVGILGVRTGVYILWWRTLTVADWAQDHAKWGVTAAAPPACCGLPGRGSPLGAAVCFADLNRCLRAAVRVSAGILRPAELPSRPKTMLA